MENDEAKLTARLEAESLAVRCGRRAPGFPGDAWQAAAENLIAKAKGFSAPQKRFAVELLACFRADGFVPEF